jgi:hypothetical protein
MPSGWTITSADAGKFGSRSGNTWHVTFSQLTLSVAGPSGSHETMTADINPTLGNSTTQIYQLN